VSLINFYTNIRHLSDISEGDFALISTVQWSTIYIFIISMSSG